MKMRHPSAAASVLALVLATLFLLITFAVCTAVVELERSEKRATIQREFSGNESMIFAFCKQVQRRDVFEQHRLDRALTIELQYQDIMKPFGPTFNAYFRARRKGLIKTIKIQKQQFVDSDCIKDTETAYDEGYGNVSTPNGRPLTLALPQAKPSPQPTPSQQPTPSPRAQPTY